MKRNWQVLAASGAAAFVLMASPALAALNDLQRSAGMSPTRATAWSGAVKRERRTGRTRSRRRLIGAATRKERQ